MAAAQDRRAGVRQRHGRRCTRKGRCDCPWEAFVYSKRDGRKLRKAFPTKAAALSWRRDAGTKVEQRLLRAPTGTTLRQAADTWLEGARSGVIRTRSGVPYKPGSLRSYDQQLRLRVLPELGAAKLTEIARSDLQDLADRLVADGLDPSTVAGTFLPVRAIYRRAMSRGEVAANPTSGLEIPTARKRRERIAPPEECAQLLEALPASERALWATAMYGGLRRGELMALRVEDVDLGAGVIHVKRGWDVKEGEIATKNGNGRRVPIAAVLRDYLDQHLLSLDWQEGLMFGAYPASPFGLSRTATVARKAWDAENTRRQKAAKEGEQVELLTAITLHECRHTFASLMIAAGVNAKALSTYMGHSTITITLDRYGHLMPGNEAEAAGLLDAYLERADTQARLAALD